MLSVSPAPKPALTETTVETTRPPRPILFDVHLDSWPPTYELLFLAELDSDHRVARVPLKKLPESESHAYSHAFSEFQQLTEEDIDRYCREARLIDRSEV